MQKFYSKQNSEYWWAVGQIGSLQSDWLLAAQAFQRAADLAVNPYDDLIDLAYVLYRLGDWESEEQVYLKAMEARPGSMYPYIGLGQIRRREGDFTLALNWYQKAEALMPTDFLPKFLIGELYLENGDLNKAREFLEAAHTLNPGDENTRYLLAQTLNKNGDLERALLILTPVVEISENPPLEVLILLGDLRLQIGDINGALVAYQQAYAIRPDDLLIQEKITRLLELTNTP
jgi:tetratricopeptide (TPR) repeat protein